MSISILREHRHRKRVERLRQHEYRKRQCQPVRFLSPERFRVISLRLFRYGGRRQQYGSACTVQLH
ncbi:hypothetical protein [Lachnoclostridium sp. An76]|uniref:hypothetical protein n=1 Tax=Lachnoclostridium sp. An76 TaxID=1965654 RepID=UPI001FA84524|nr:hypothetical protein [Lachnoclostridium sp. An76]